MWDVYIPKVFHGIEQIKVIFLLSSWDLHPFCCYIILQKFSQSSFKREKEGAPNLPQ